MNKTPEPAVTWTTIAPPWIALVITIVGTALLLWTLRLQRKTLIQQQIITKLQIQAYYKSILPILESIGEVTKNSMFGITTIECRIVLKQNDIKRFTYQCFNKKTFTLLPLNITESEIFCVNNCILLHFTYLDLCSDLIIDKENHLLKLSFENTEGNKYSQDIYYNSAKSIRIYPAEMLPD